MERVRERKGGGVLPDRVTYIQRRLESEWVREREGEKGRVVRSAGRSRKRDDKR